jgi:hypothetical protein
MKDKEIDVKSRFSFFFFFFFFVVSLMKPINYQLPTNFNDPLNFQKRRKKKVEQLDPPRVLTENSTLLAREAQIGIILSFLFTRI